MLVVVFVRPVLLPVAGGCGLGDARELALEGDGPELDAVVVLAGGSQLVAVRSAEPVHVRPAVPLALAVLPVVDQTIVVVYRPEDRTLGSPDRGDVAQLRRVLPVRPLPLAPARGRRRAVRRILVHAPESALRVDAPQRHVPVVLPRGGEFDETGLLRSRRPDVPALKPAALLQPLMSAVDLAVARQRPQLRVEFVDAALHGGELRQ